MIDFNYEPLSSEEADKFRYHLLDDGFYDGTIEYAESKISRSNNPMGEFILRVWDKDGRPKEIKDYLPFIPSMMWKARHLCESTGLIKEFDEKRFRPELTIGRNITVNIGTQLGKEIPIENLNGKPMGTKYPDKNVVIDYITKDNASKIVTTKVEEDPFPGEDIPF